MKRFRIGNGPIYRLDDIEELSLKDLLVLGVQTEELGRRVDMNVIQEMKTRIERLNEDERKADKDAPWLFAISLWAARIKAGEDVTFVEAVDFPMSQLQFLAEPADRKPKKAANPTRSRPASGRAASKSTAPPPSARTSKTASTAG